MVGYVGTLVALFICKIFLRIPFLIGFLLSSLLLYYVFLIATYYFTELYKKTSLSAERVFEKQHPEPDRG